MVRLRDALLAIAFALPGCASQAARCDDMPAALAAMRSADQALRERATQSALPDPALVKQLALVDRENAVRLAQWLKRCGWPSVKRHGQAAGDDAWLLVQHADHDRAFQRHALYLLRAAVVRGDARGGHLAYLSDRLAIADNKPQPYGTQFRLEACRLELLPIDSREAVNRRRSAIPGMPSLEAYEAQLRKQLPPSCGSGQ